MPYLGKQLGFTNLAGDELFLDADSDTSITADTDDKIDIKTGGTDAVTIDSSQNVIFTNDVQLKSDDSVLSFGADLDVTVTHDPDYGLILKSSATADDNPFLLTLQTGETDLAADDVIGKIQFQAPDEGTGTDAILVSAAIQARSEGDFAADANATSLDFMLGSSEAAATKATFNSKGNTHLPEVRFRTYANNDWTTATPSNGNTNLDTEFQAGNYGTYLYCLYARPNPGGSAIYADQLVGIVTSIGSFDGGLNWRIANTALHTHSASSNTDITISFTFHDGSGGESTSTTTGSHTIRAKIGGQATGFEFSGARFVMYQINAGAVL